MEMSFNARRRPSMYWKSICSYRLHMLKNNLNKEKSEKRRRQRHDYWEGDRLVRLESHKYDGNGGNYGNKWV